MPRDFDPTATRDNLSNRERNEHIPLPTGPEVVTHRGKMIEVVTQEMQIGEKVVNFERARRSPGTRLLITSEEGNVLLTREYRTEVGGWDVRLPGGKVFDSLEEYSEALEDGEDILAKSKLAAEKEALEEVGLQTTEVEHFYTSTCGATVEWDLHYFQVSTSPEELGDQNLEAGEDIETAWYTPEEAIEIAMMGGMSEDRSAIVLLRHLYALREEEKSGVNELEDSRKQGHGVALEAQIASNDLDSLRVRKEKMATLDEVESIIFVGSSLAGKSTLVDAVRDALNEDPALADAISIPKRIITRPQRQNDNLAENIFMSPEGFAEMVDANQVGFFWTRRMEGVRTERYGFEHPETGTLPVYSANNAVMDNMESVFPAELLQKALVVSVYAPDATRGRRLQERSPDLLSEKPEEVAYRLADKAINMYPYAHIQVNNFGRFAERSAADVVALLKLVLQCTTEPDA